MTPNNLQVWRLNGSFHDITLYENGRKKHPVKKCQNPLGYILVFGIFFIAILRFALFFKLVMEMQPVNNQHGFFTEQQNKEPKSDQDKEGGRWKKKRHWVTKKRESLLLERCWSCSFFSKPSGIFTLQGINKKALGKKIPLETPVSARLLTATKWFNLATLIIRPAGNTCKYSKTC